MQKKFEYKESRGLPNGPNEMFTYVTGVFDIYQAPSNIEGQGMFAGKSFKKGDLIGLAHSNGQPASQLGRMHNHDENSPTMISKKSGNDRFVFAAKDLQPGDELTTDYRMQPELEQPEDFQYGGESRPQATISQYEEPAWYEKAADYLASPMTTLSYIVQGKDLPDRLPINAENRNTYDMVIDMVNPAAWYAYAESADRNIAEGNYVNAGFDALGAIPIVPAYLSQGKNVVKGGKNVIKNVARSADEVAAGSDDIVKATVKDTKPGANRLDYVEEVNPISQAQAENLVEQGRNAELFKAFEEGANTIDDFVKSYAGDLSSPEGFKRLVKQEADYLRSIGFDEARIAAQAEINAGARLNEIINIGNTNRAIVQGERSAGNIVKNKYNFNNASYTANMSGTEYIDDLYYKSGMDLSNFHLNKTKVGAKVLPGETNLGTMFNNSKAVAAHEIGGHGLQSGRRLPVDSRLKKLEPLDEMTEGTAEAYRYFMKGSKGKEPSAFLHELRQAMLDQNLIKNRYQYVSPDQLKRFQTILDIRPSGTMNTMAGKYHSNTRLLDFMKPTQSNFDLLARELNKLPAMVPIGVGLGGAAALSEYQDGGQTSWTDYLNPMNWGASNRDQAGSFGNAFRAARIDGDDEFMWKGDRYTTELAPTIEEKETVQEEKLFYNKDILKGLSEEQVARRQSLLNAANVVAAAQGDDDDLRKLLVMSAVMENTLGADPKAYGRDYTRSPMSIDNVAYNDLFNIREGAKGYTTQQKKNASWLEGLGINSSEIDSLLKADDPMASMAVARLVYGRAPEALPSGDDPTAMYNYYLKYYNKGGVDKYGGAEAHRKKFNDYYNQIYREFGGETDQFKIYKDYVYGVYDGTEMQNKAQKVYDKLNRVYYKEAKESGTTVPNYILSKVMKQSDN